MSESTQANTDQPTIVYGSSRKPDAAIPRPGLELRKSNVAVVGDATAAAQIPGYDGYDAAMTNFRFLASDVWNANEATERLSAL